MREQYPSSQQKPGELLDPLGEGVSKRSGDRSWWGAPLVHVLRRRLAERAKRGDGVRGAIGRCAAIENSEMRGQRVAGHPEEGALIAKALEAAREKGQSLADALVAMAERSLSAAETKGDERYQVIVHTEASLTAATVEGRFAEKTPISAEVLRKLTCDAAVRTVAHSADGSVLDVGRKTRAISTKLRIALVQRDQGCRFPRCTHQYVDAPHVQHWADGGETSLANLISLCGFHHGQLHDGKIVLDENLAFRYANGRPMTNALPTTMPAVNARDSALCILARTIPVPSGERLDLGYALACLRYEPAETASLTP